MGDVSKQITLGYKSFGSNYKSFWDNYVTVSNADAKKRTSNEIVANGGLNGSYATITTADGFKLENVPVIVQPGQAVELLVWLWIWSCSLERRNDGRFKRLFFIQRI
jgi:hypothetical protein